MKITQQQNVEMGQVIAAGLLLLALYRRQWPPVGAAVVVLFVTMLAPVVLYPLAWAWMGIARILAEVNMRILLTLLFCLLVVPVGVWRRFRRRDSLRLRRFKQGHEPGLLVREQVYKKEDLLHTF
ncbi:MAG TPA: hypothetical protein VGC22_11150 [Chitinophaga sp.]